MKELMNWGTGAGFGAGIAMTLSTGEVQLSAVTVALCLVLCLLTALCGSIIVAGGRRSKQKMVERAARRAKMFEGLK